MRWPGPCSAGHWVVNPAGTDLREGGLAWLQFCPLCPLAGTQPCSCPEGFSILVLKPQSCRRALLFTTTCSLCVCMCVCACLVFSDPELNPKAPPDLGVSCRGH